MRKKIENNMIEKNNLIPCCLCGKNDFVLLFSGHDYLGFSPLTFKVMKCNQCGLVCLNPYPENLIKYYDAYHKSFLEKDIFLLPWLLPDRIKKIKKIKTPGKILDIGCGVGIFLLDMQKEGWDVYGCDIYPDSCNIAKNMNGLKNIYNEDVLSLNLSENYFDVITLWHVLEHLTKPQDTLKKINKLLKDDGILIIESPDFSSIQSKFFKSKWFPLELPRHIYQFSPNTVKKLLNSVNFEILRKDYVVNPRINFVDLKQSLLRYLGINKYLTEEEPKKKISVEEDFHKTSVTRNFFRYIFNYFCLIISLFLALIHCEDSFRVYCKKLAKKER
ncbi:MAG: class I SAM-dependent methyltransferase [Elusimicrobiota bacterium]